MNCLFIGGRRLFCSNARKFLLALRWLCFSVKMINIQYSLDIRKYVIAPTFLNIIQFILISVKCFPPDVLHDVFEGVIPEDLLGIIRILSIKGWFTLDQYNKALQNIGYLSYERADKPCPLPTSSKVKKLKGKALSNWVHLRNWPLVIRQFICDREDVVLRLGLILHDLVERLCAQEFYLYEVKLLDDKIVEYLDLRKIVREDYPNLMNKPKLKHHFLRKETLHSAFGHCYGT